ncbi:MAG TPA: SMC-Scp complex subunit ScpB [Syntrophorhabdaceae bacterium]|nr:SMC-Scp complex subunit ScpB [Syntrophorhabdaceae bacterium]HQM80489.1 SMC-Scp complex subunit ScpB [Syntrophorhabdaceae bacterium]
MELTRIIESILFASPKPISLKLFHKRLPEFPPEDIEKSLHELVHEYKELRRSFEIVEVAGGYQMRTKIDYREWARRFVKEKDVSLTKSVLETLSIVAYKQPVAKKEIDTIRGVDSTRAVKQLLERRLIEIAGRNGDEGKRLVFRTTDKFLEAYGLKSLEDLPTLKEIELLEK